MFSESFAGIAPSSVPGFMVAELIGVGTGTHLLLGAATPKEQAHAQADRVKPTAAAK